MISTTSQKNPKNNSAVCQYFDAEKENVVVCRMCQNKLAFNHSTSATCDHIQQRHVNDNLQGQQAAGANFAKGSLAAHVSFGLTKSYMILFTHLHNDSADSRKKTYLVSCCHLL